MEKAFEKETSTKIKNLSITVVFDNNPYMAGCAHPGIVKILKTAKELIKDKILFVIGGLHLGGMSEPQLKEIINNFRKLGVKHVGPCHCSGDLARQLFKREYQKDYIDVGVGRLIKFD